MGNSFNRHRVDPAQFARAGSSVAATTPMAALRRLASEAVADLDGRSVTWSAQGEWRELAGSGTQVWLHLQAQALVPLCCQRCLEVLEQPIAFSRDFRFVPTEEQAASEDEESEEDVLALTPDFDLLELVEDELLLDLPLVPKHEVCPKPVKLAVADADFDATEAEQPHPFAALADWAAKKR